MIMRGTPQDFLDALNNKIDELSDEELISSSKSVNEISDDAEPIYGKSESYIDTLLDLVHSGAEFRIDWWDISDNTLFIYPEDSNYQYEVPLDDLTFDLDHVQEDADYILRSL